MSGDSFEVIAYSGYKGDQSPSVLIVGGVRLGVLGIRDQWMDPEARYFKVRAEDGHIYLVRCDLESLRWSLVRVWAQDA